MFAGPGRLSGVSRDPSPDPDGEPPARDSTLVAASGSDSPRRRARNFAVAVADGRARKPTATFAAS